MSGERGGSAGMRIPRRFAITPQAFAAGVRRGADAFLSQASKAMAGK